MNGFIKKGDKKVFPFNSTKNIEHKGIKLFDYIELLKKNIINLFNINQVSIFGISFNDYSLTTESTYEDINYTNTNYIRNNGNKDFEVTSSGIYIKSMYKKNLTVNLSTNVRPDSGTGGLKYFRIELWRNGTMIESQFTATEVTNNGRANLTIPCFFKVTYNDVIKIKGYGKIYDTFLLTRANFELSKNNDIDYYNI